MFRPYLTPGPEMGAAVEALNEVEIAEAYLDRAKGKEQVDEATIRLIAARVTADRIIRDMKREMGLKVREYKCPFEHERIMGEVKGIEHKN